MSRASLSDSVGVCLMSGWPVIDFQMRKRSVLTYLASPILRLVEVDHWLPAQLSSQRWWSAFLLVAQAARITVENLFCWTTVTNRTPILLLMKVLMNAIIINDRDIYVQHPSYSVRHGLHCSMSNRQDDSRCQKACHLGLFQGFPKLPNESSCFFLLIQACLKHFRLVSVFFDGPTAKFNENTSGNCCARGAWLVDP